MRPNERRQEIFDRLCQRKHDTYANLAQEFNVSTRTIRYDIEILTLSYPIETVSGNGGGVKIAKGYRSCQKTLSPVQANLLNRLAKSLSGDDLGIMNSILSQFAPYIRAE